MYHIDWINEHNIQVLRTSLKFDTFLDDIKNQKSELTRLISYKEDYFIRYRLSKKIYWYKVVLHKKFKDIYIVTPFEIDEDFRRKLNRKYLRFNRDYLLNKLLK